MKAKEIKKNYEKEEKRHEKKYKKENTLHEKKHRVELNEALTCDKKKKKKK